MGGPLTLQVNAAHGLVEMSAPTLGQARRTHAARTPHMRVHAVRMRVPYASMHMHMCTCTCTCTCA